MPSEAQPNRLSVLLLDDHRVFTDLLATSLDMSPDLRCVAVANSLAEGVAMAATTAFDVAVVDVTLPDGNGIDAIEPLMAARPGARVVVLTAHPRVATAERALACGAVAVLGKDGSLGDIMTALRTATAEEPLVRTIGPEPAVPVRLTPRELDVLRQLAAGRDAARVADALGISVFTARDHIKAIMAKLDVRTQLDAVLTAGRLGLVELGSRY